MSCANCKHWTHRKNGMGRCEKFSTGTPGANWYHVEQWRGGEKIEPDTEIRTLEYDSCAGEES